MLSTAASITDTVSVGLWQSERLIFRCLDDEDDAFLASLEKDAQAFVNYSRCLPLPRGRKPTRPFNDYLKSRLLAAVICLSSSPTNNLDITEEESTADLVPIGVIHLGDADPSFVQHRCAELGILISKKYRNQRYGSEAIEWALNWAFRYGGLHRVELFAYAYNEAAIRLYKRVGFKAEGCRRDAQFVNGMYWDVILLGILADEWERSLVDKSGQSTLESRNGNVS